MAELTPKPPKLKALIDDCLRTHMGGLGRNTPEHEQARLALEQAIAAELAKAGVEKWDEHMRVVKELETLRAENARLRTMVDLQTERILGLAMDTEGWGTR